MPDLEPTDPNSGPAASNPSDPASHYVGDDALDVLAIGAHPDDVEFTCGGTLAKLARQGYRVGIVDLTDGEPTPHSPGPAVRLQEAGAAADALGIHKRINLGLPNRRLMDGLEARVALARELRYFRPSLVIGFGDKTPLHSPDHWQAVQITEAAVFYSRLTKWDQFFPGLPPHSIRQLMYYRSGSEASPIQTTGTVLTVDISDTLEQKLNALRCYRSQFDHKPHIESLVRSAAIVSGQSAGVAAGELFVTAQMLAIDDLYRTVVGAGRDEGSC